MIGFENSSRTASGSRPANETGQITSAFLRGGVEVIDSIAAEWAELCQERALNVPFYRPEYFRAHVRNLEANRPVALAIARCASRLVAVLPLVEVTERWYGLPLRLLTSPRGYHYPRFDAICSEHIERQQACTALLEALGSQSSWQAIRLSEVRSDSSASVLCESARRFGWTTETTTLASVPYVTLAGWSGDWDWYIKQRSSNFRHMLRKAKRRVDAKGELLLKRFITADQEALSTFYQLEASGWKGRSGTAIRCDEKLRRFYDESASEAARSGYFSLYLLECGSEPIAGLYAFTTGESCCVPKLAYDEAYKDIAPGHLLVNEVLRDCAMRGVQEFDFLGEWMPWKGAWTSSSRTHAAHHIFRGAIARLIQSLHFTIRPRVARLLRRSKRPEDVQQNNV